MKKKILITAANGIVMKSLIKQLKKNFYIIGVDKEINGIAKRECDEFYKSPDGSSKEFIYFLKKRAIFVDFVFLFVDEEILNVINNHVILKNVIQKIILSKKETLETCINKKKFSNFCKQNKINIPSEKYSKNMLAKPIFGRGGKGIIKINNREEYKHYKNKKFILQKFISGTEYTIDCLFDKEGQLIFGLPRKRIIKKGVSIVGKIAKDIQIINFIKNISKKLIFFGPINIQVIKDLKNQIWLIEINPRLSGSIEFSIRAGFNPFIYFINPNKFKNRKLDIHYDKTYYRYLEIIE